MVDPTDDFDNCIDWPRFFDEMDIVLAHIINDAKSEELPEEFWPSKITAFKVVEYAKKRIAKNAAAPAIEDIEPDITYHPIQFKDEVPEVQYPPEMIEDMKAQEDGRLGYDYDTRPYYADQLRRNKDGSLRKVNSVNHPCLWCGQDLKGHDSYHPLCLVTKLKAGKAL